MATGLMLGSGPSTREGGSGYGHWPYLGVCRISFFTFVDLSRSELTFWRADSGSCLLEQACLHAPYNSPIKVVSVCSPDRWGQGGPLWTLCKTFSRQRVWAGPTGRRLSPL